MEVLLIACYIIGSLSAFILITFRIAGSSCIYIYFFFSETSYLDFKAIVFRISCPIQNTNNTVYRALPMLRIIISFLSKSVSRNVTHSLTRPVPSKITLICELLNEHSWRQTVR